MKRIKADFQYLQKHKDKQRFSAKTETLAQRSSTVVDMCRVRIGLAQLCPVSGGMRARPSGTTAPKSALWPC
jgi:hypothetical protein